MTDGNHGLGLAGAAALGSGLAEKIILDDLRRRLSSLADGDHPLPADRANIIRLLETLVQSLGPMMSVPLGRLEDGTTILTDHPTIILLQQTIGMLADLDNGKTAEAFRPNPAGANASLTTAERILQETLSVTLRIVQRHFGLSSQTKAAHFFAKRLQKAGKTRANGKPYTAGFLRTLRHRKRKQPIVSR